MELYTRQQYRDCVIGLGCQCAQICSLTMLHVSHPYVSCLPFHPYMPLFLIRRIFNLLVIYEVFHKFGQTLSPDLLAIATYYKEGVISILSMFFWESCGILVCNVENRNPSPCFGAEK